MEKAIDNLNQVSEERQKMIDTIIFKNHTVKTDNQYDSLYKKYNNKSFNDLKKLL